MRCFHLHRGRVMCTNCVQIHNVLTIFSACTTDLHEQSSQEHTVGLSVKIARLMKLLNNDEVLFRKCVNREKYGLIICRTLDVQYVTVCQYSVGLF